MFERHSMRLINLDIFSLNVVTKILDFGGEETTIFDFECDAGFF